MTSHDRILELLDENKAGLALGDFRDAMPGVPEATIRAALRALTLDQVVRVKEKNGMRNVYVSNDNWAPQPWRHPYRREN